MYIFGERRDGLAFEHEPQVVFEIVGQEHARHPAFGDAEQEHKAPDGPATLGSLRVALAIRDGQHTAFAFGAVALHRGAGFVAPPILAGLYMYFAAN